jgi:hypothetical protein
LDAKATGAYEFARQMGSNNLKKINPNFNCSLSLHSRPDAPKITAEFVDGQKWDIEAPTADAMSIRSQFFEKAQEIEDHYEMEFGGLPGFDGEDISSKSKGAASKPGGKK